MSALAHFLHLAVPHRSNNYRARLLQPLGLFTLALAFMLSQVILQSYSTENPGVLGYAANIPVSEVIRITNQKRTEAGLVALQTNSSLSQAAEAKGRHMLEQDYWAHVAPDGTEPWAFFSNVGYKYRYAGENLARDFSNPQSAVDAWMASPSHRDNLMSPKYTEIGLAVVEGDLNGVDTTIIVQLFGTPMASAAAPIVPEVASDSSDNVAPAVEVESTPLSKVEDTSEVGETSVVQADAPVVERISPLEINRVTASMVIGLLFILLLIDIVVIKSHKLPRNGGRPIAHISFLAVIMVIIIVAKAGSII